MFIFFFEFFRVIIFFLLLILTFIPINLSNSVIVKISFTAKQPKTTWSSTNPREYGFFSNVNPNVDHPRWSQATERVIGEGLFGERRKTEMFNGYQEQVAYLYKGMDLKTYY